MKNLFSKSGLKFKKDEATCFSVHSSFYLWAFILLGWVLSPFLSHFPDLAVGVTWIYIWTLFYTLTMLLFDISTSKLLICSGVLALIIITSKYIELVRQVVFIHHIVQHFVDLHPTINAGAMSFISWMLFIPWFIMLVESYRSGKKSFSPNGIEERSLWVGREITDRSGMHFVCKYPNLLQTILGFGSGSLVSYNGDNESLKEWHNIVGLYFIWDRLDEILHQRSAIVDNTPVDPVEVEDIKG